MRIVGKMINTLGTGENCAARSRALQKRIKASWTATGIVLLALVLLSLGGAIAGADTMVFQIGGLVNSTQSYNPSTSFTGTGFVSTQWRRVLDVAPGGNFANTDQYVAGQDVFNYTPYFIAQESVIVSNYLSNASGYGYRYWTYDFWETQMQIDVSSLRNLDISSASLSFNSNTQYDRDFTDINLQFTSFNSTGSLGWYNSLDTVGTVPGAGGSLGSVGLSFPETQTGDHSVDVTGLLKARIASGQNYFAMLMETTARSYLEYAYQAPPNSSNVFLTVNYVPIPVTSEPAVVPIPAAAPMALLGMGLVAAVRRRKTSLQA